MQATPDLRIENNWRSIGVVSGASLVLGGCVACLKIGALRFAPLTAVIVGLGILTSSIYNQKSPKTVFPPERKIQPIEGIDRNFTYNLRLLQRKRIDTVLKNPMRNFPRQIDQGSIAQQKNAWKLLMMVCATIALSIPIFYFTRSIGCIVSGVALFESANPNRRRATEINQSPNLNHLPKIGQKTFDPRLSTLLQKDSYKIDLWYFDQYEVEKNWNTVNRLGTTHIELAGHLQAIWDSASYCDDGIFTNFHPFLYDPNTLKDNTIGKESGTQFLLGCKTRQWCCRRNSILKVINPMNGARIKLTTSVDMNFDGLDAVDSNGIIDVIKRYGLYEYSSQKTGPKDRGRIDPVSLVALLTGKAPELIQSAM